MMLEIVEGDEPELRWARAGSCAALARILATAGRIDEAMELVATLPRVIELTPIWEGNYPRIVCDAAATLWIAQRSDYIEIIERGVREKVVRADYRYPMQDGRTALGRICALQGRHDEAIRLFAEARRVTEEQGARPCRAIIDYDEALMLVRRAAPGDRDRARPLLDAALSQMQAIGMGGWATRAAQLRASLTPSP
jgi:hypothetical protein